MGRLLLALVAVGALGLATADLHPHPHSHNSTANDTPHVHHGIHVAALKFRYVAVPLLLTAFIMVVVVVKIGFEHIHWLSSALPESCLLIFLGFVLGCFFLLDPTDTFRLLVFDPDTFFLYLLPPIILEAAYSLRDRAFAENFGTIILYAVVGTILNWGLIGMGLFGIYAAGGMGYLEITLLDCLIFAALISAVDPVAVLAIFQEVGVNKMLYFMVFGESLLNDAVTVVLYSVLVTFTHMDEIYVKDIGLGVVAFLVSSGGAMIIGIVLGLATGFITKFTGKIRVVEPTTLFGMAYLSYLSAELFHFSGIISIICCGLVQAHFAMENISSKSYVTVHYFSKVLSSVTESLIFIILGVMLVNDDFWARGWSTTFSLYSLGLCSVVRIAVVFFLAAIVNRKTAGIRKISKEEQCIMSYGGLRGAVSFSLVFMLSESETKHKDTLMCATYIVILFTVFVQGSTIKLMVKLLSIRLEDSETTMFAEINRNLTDNMTTGMEEICGHHGVHFWAAVSHNLSKRFLRPILQKSPTGKGKNLLNVYAEVEIQSRLTSTAGRSMSTMVTSGSAIWDELNMVDRSAMQPSTAESLLDAQDAYVQEERKRQRSKTSMANIERRSQLDMESMNTVPSPPKAKSKVSISLSAPNSPTAPKPRAATRRASETPHRVSLHELRGFMAHPLHKQVHYTAGDRNLRSEVSEKHHGALKHILDHRKRSLRQHLASKFAYNRPKTSAMTSKSSMAEIKETTEHEETETSPFLTARLSSSSPSASRPIPKVVFSIEDGAPDPDDL